MDRTDHNPIPDFLKQKISHLQQFAAFLERLSLPCLYALGILERLWQEGNLAGLTNQQIANLIEYKRDADQLVMALRDTGWLGDDDFGRRCVRDHWRDPVEHAKFLGWCEEKEVP
jgi:hypothetical protein